VNNESATSDYVGPNLIALETDAVTEMVSVSWRPNSGRAARDQCPWMLFD